MIFTNKHVIIAMLVAPILAIIAWFAIGEMVGEKPQAASAGNSYPLVEMSNCRYDSGICGLENKEFKLEMTLLATNTGAELSLTSRHTLDGVMVAVAPAGKDQSPKAMRSATGDGMHWTLGLSHMPGPDERIRLVAHRDRATWFGEAGTRFTLGNDQAGSLTR